MLLLAEQLGVGRLQPALAVENQRIVSTWNSDQRSKCPVTRWFELNTNASVVLRFRNVKNYFELDTVHVKLLQVARLFLKLFSVWPRRTNDGIAER